MHHVSLCAGYGGIDLGLRRAVPRLRTVAYSEIEGYACANLVAKIEAGLLDPAPIWTDVKTFPYAEFHRCVHILSGGYPCQPFSASGKRLGRDDARHLWPWIADGIDAMRPSLCFFENVEGHITLGLRDVLNDLGELGYRATWGIFSASEVGAPHQRKRVFILAHSGHLFQGGWAQSILSPYPYPTDTGEALAYSEFSGLEGLGSDPRQSYEPESRDGGPSIWPAGPSEPQHWWEPPRTVGHTTRREDDGRESGDLEVEAGERRCGDHAVDGSGQGWGFGETQPPLGGNPDGSSCGLDNGHLFTSTCNRTDELRLLGNGVVPATAALAFKTLLKELI